MTKPTNTTNEKALGRSSEGSKKCATNALDSTGSHLAQLHLDLGDQLAAVAAQLSLRARSWSISKPRTKLETILRLFTKGRNVNRFEAEHHHDHCLHSTVSTLQNDYGILIARHSETIPCFRGRSSVRCMRYWLDTSPDNITAARALLSMLETRA